MRGRCARPSRASVRIERAQRDVVVALLLCVGAGGCDVLTGAPPPPPNVAHAASAPSSGAWPSGTATAASVAAGEPEIIEPADVIEDVDVAREDASGEPGAAPPGADVVAADPLPFVGSDHDQDVILEHLRTAAPEQFKPVGSTSMVYRVRLEGPVNGAFKPLSRHVPGGPYAEIAAYRIARFLRLDNVPPVTRRRFRRADLEEMLHPRFVEMWPELDAWTRWDRGEVEGAIIYWIPGMRELGLERERRMEHWTWYLSQRGTLPDGKEALYADLSRTLCFDYLVGNWDRWSGSNAQGHEQRHRMFARDHDRSFQAPLTESLHHKLAVHLQRTEKLSRTLIDRLRAMNDVALRDALADEDGEAPLLTDHQIARVLDRRDALLSYAEALVDEYGADRVFVFP